MNDCSFFHFGLLVTGKGEREHLDKIFSSLTKTGLCTFKIIRFFGQRSPITSTKRTLTMVGTGKTIPDRDAEEIGLPARRFLEEKDCAFVLLIDDLEHDRRATVWQIFDRYSQIFDTIIHNSDQRRRVSVHFLVNMLEAYYFANSLAVNTALASSVLTGDYEGDVEEIRHPKNALKKLYKDFDEKDDGGKILDLIELEEVLNNPETCASLRTIVAWCVKILEQNPYGITISDKYALKEGILSAVTGKQLS